MTAPDIVPQSDPLSPHLAEWTDYARSVRRQLLEFVQSLPPSAYEKRISPEGWSIAGVLEHLALIEDGIGRLINRMSKQLRAENAFEAETGSILGLLDDFALENNHRKLMAPAPYHPTGVPSVEETLQKLEEIRTRLYAAVEAANGIDLSKASAPHPFLGPLTGYQWLVLIAQHERRHLKQMQEIQTASSVASEFR